MINQASISVKFLLDEKGDPLFIDDGQKRHYKIVVFAKTFPEDVYAVEYQLDSSYVNPFRIQDNRDKNFEFQTTTYGDYSISASLLGKKQNYLTSCIISKALEENNEQPLNPNLGEAIGRIKAN
jgi:hypothetical protein